MLLTWLYSLLVCIVCFVLFCFGVYYCVLFGLVLLHWLFDIFETHLLVMLDLFVLVYWLFTVRL